METPLANQEVIGDGGSAADGDDEDKVSTASSAGSLWILLLLGTAWLTRRRMLRTLVNISRGGRRSGRALSSSRAQASRSPRRFYELKRALITAPKMAPKVSVR